MAVDVEAYPQPRDRAGSGVVGSVAPAAVGAVPFSRIWSFRVRTGLISTRTILRSPAMQGPAIVKSLAWMLTGQANAGLKTAWQLGYSETQPVEQFDSLTLTEPPGQRIIDSSDRDDGPNAVAFNGGTSVGFTVSVNGSWPLPLNYVVMEPEFYVWLMIQSVANLQQVIEGMVTVVNNVSPRALENFL